MPRLRRRAADGAGRPQAGGRPRDRRGGGPGRGNRPVAACPHGAGRGGGRDLRVPRVGRLGRDHRRGRQRHRRRCHVLIPGRRPMRIIDLSQDIYEGMKVYPGHLKTVQFEHATHEETAPRFEGGFSFQTTGFILNDNGPTHCDSFSHLDPDPAAETIDQMPLDLFYGPAVCLGITGFAPRTDITPEALARVEANSTVNVTPGDIVLFYTGTWNRFAGDKRYLSDFPGLGESAGGWVVGPHGATFGAGQHDP